MGVVTPRASYPATGDGGNGRVDERARGAALSPLRRLAVALAWIAAGLGLALLALLVASANDPPVTPPVLAELFALQVALPALVGWLVWRASAAALWRDGPHLVIEAGGRRVEVPLEAVVRVEAWRLPLPAAGIRLRLRSGGAVPLGFATRDPEPLLDLLSRAGVEGVREVQDATGVVWARARAPFGRRRPWQWALRFPGFALLPAAILFQVHQRIAFGGILGEWYLMGPAAWLRTALVYWGTTTLLLLLYAGLLRGLAEALCLVAARVAPPRAAGVRRAVERAAQLLYYGGVPALLALRFLA